MASFTIVTQFEDDPGHLMVGCTVQVEGEAEPRYYEQEVIGIPENEEARTAKLQAYVNQMEHELNNPPPGTEE